MAWKSLSVWNTPLWPVEHLALPYVNSSPNLTHLAVLISNLKLTHPQRFLSVI